MIICHRVGVKAKTAVNNKTRYFAPLIVSHPFTTVRYGTVNEQFLSE